MLSAPLSIPPTTPAAFIIAFGDATLSRSSNKPWKPADSANDTGSTPAAETRFGSSNTGRIMWEAFTYEVTFSTADGDFSNHLFLTQQGHLDSRHESPTVAQGSGVAVGRDSVCRSFSAALILDETTMRSYAALIIHAIRLPTMPRPIPLRNIAF